MILRMTWLVDLTKLKLVAGIPADSVQSDTECHVHIIGLNGPPRAGRVDTHPHHRACHLQPRQTTCEPQLINSYAYHGATAHVLLTASCWCLSDDRSLQGTGWPLTGRTVCVSTVWSPCLQDQRTSWALAVSSCLLTFNKCYSLESFASVCDTGMTF